MMKNNNSYKLPLALVFSLFFLWAISSTAAYHDSAADEDLRTEYL